MNNHPLDLSHFGGAAEAVASRIQMEREQAFEEGRKVGYEQGKADAMKALAYWMPKHEDRGGDCLCGLCEGYQKGLEVA